MYEDLLVPVGRWDGAEHAADVALDLVARYGARLHVLGVVERPLILASQGDLADALEAETASAVDDVVERATGRGLEVTDAIRGGVPYRETARYATDAGVDLVVVTGGYGPRRGVDVARLTREVDASVLVVG